jgi:putative flippase GtrA
MINGIYSVLSRNKTLARFLSPELLGQAIRYLITGFSSAAIEFSLLILSKDIFSLSVVVSNSIALTIVFWFNYLMNRKWSFKSTTSLKKQLPMYLVLFIFNLGASDLVMYLLTSRLSLHYLLAKVFAIAAVMTWNFLLYRKVIYK